MNQESIRSLMSGKQARQGTDLGGLMQELRWPKFRWRVRVAVWLTIVSAVITSVIFLCPDLSAGRSVGYRVLLWILIIFSTFLLVAIPWFFTAGRTIVERVRWHPKLLETYNGERHELADMQKIVVDIVQNHIFARSFEIRKAAFTKGRLCILLARRSGYEMAAGYMVDVIDQEDNKFMGKFKVTELHENAYYAEEISNIDPVWLGYVRQQGETEVIPHMVAICIHKGG